MKKRFFIANMIIAMASVQAACSACTNNNETEEMTTNATMVQDYSATQETDGIRFTLNGVEWKMIMVEKGTFMMGSDNSGQSNEKPAHQVTLTQDYLMGQTEVTEALWNLAMGRSGGRTEYPIASVTRDQCQTFVDNLNALMHEAGMPAEWNFKMPTEAQWEFAARGGNKSKGYKYCGSDNLDEVAWTSANHSSSAANAVAKKKPNELGLYDMSGNVYEWVFDYPNDYPSTPQTDPCYATRKNQYIKRGGSIYYSDSYRFTPHYRYYYGGTDWTIGFRLCLMGPTTANPTTGMETASVNEKSSYSKGVYSLRGTRLLARAADIQQLPKGVYIVDGTKRIVK